MIEHSPLDIVQLGGAEEVGDLARHVEGDRRFRGLNVLVGGRLLGQKVGHGRADGAATDTVLMGESGDGLAAQVRGAHVGDRVDRDGGAASAPVAGLGTGGLAC
ncbi:hypothetical protein [Streptomyces sp. NPDC055793]